MGAISRRVNIMKGIITFPTSCRFIFWVPKRREWRVSVGVEGGVKASCFMPRFWVYHFMVAGMDATVKTRWSSEIMVAEGVVEDILRG